MPLVRNIKLTIEYDGTEFNGWQIQDKKRRTVQGETEKVLCKIFKEEIRLYGSGRTDSGVHAYGQVANFKTESQLDCGQILKALNFWLPEDIVIRKAEEVPLNFHAQFSAKNKIYRYTVLNRSVRCAQQRLFSFHYPYRTNLARMRREAKGLSGRKNFKSFQATDSLRAENNTIRTVKKISIRKHGDLVLIDIEANGFLYKMVRNIVGTLLEIGSGLRPEGSIKKILQEKNRNSAGKTIPSKGLCLIEVKY